MFLYLAPTIYYFIVKEWHYSYRVIYRVISRVINRVINRVIDDVNSPILSCFIYLFTLKVFISGYSSVDLLIGFKLVCYATVPRTVF